MTYSLNELESMLKKAVTGAGLPPGHADAIATAGIWLARRRMPACDIIARALDGGMRECQVERSAQRVSFRDARAAVDGIAAIDLLLAGNNGDSIVLDELDEPMLLLGVAGAAADVHGIGFELRQGKTCLQVGATGCEARAIEPGTVTLVRTKAKSKVNAARLSTRYDPAAVGDRGWEPLAALACKTYVPASEQSRLSGAGAGLTDND